MPRNRYEIPVTREPPEGAIAAGGAVASAANDVRRTAGKGYALTFVYISLTATSLVFLNHVGGSIPVSVSLFYMALAASGVFNVVDFRNVPRNHRSATRHWKSFTVLSVAFVSNWFFSYYSATHAPAEFFIAVFFLTSAVCSCLADRKWMKASLCLGAILAAYRLTGTGPGVLGTSILAGISMYIYYISSLRFARNSGLGPISVVSMRCYCLLACTIAYLIATGATGQLLVSPEVAWSLVFLVLANMVLPSFLSQTCLSLVGVSSFTFMNSLIPVLTFALQSLVLVEWHPGLLLATTIATLALNYDILAGRKRLSPRIAND